MIEVIIEVIIKIIIEIIIERINNVVVKKVQIWLIDFKK